MTYRDYESFVYDFLVDNVYFDSDTGKIVEASKVDIENSCTRRLSEGTIESVGISINLKEDSDKICMLEDDCRSKICTIKNSSAETNIVIDNYRLVVEDKSYAVQWLANDVFMGYLGISDTTISISFVGYCSHMLRNLGMPRVWLELDRNTLKCKRVVTDISDYLECFDDKRYYIVSIVNGYATYINRGNYETLKKSLSAYRCAILSSAPYMSFGDGLVIRRESNKSHMGYLFEKGSKKLRINLTKLGEDEDVEIVVEDKVLAVNHSCIEFLDIARDDDYYLLTFQAGRKSVVFMVDRDTLELEYIKGVDNFDKLNTDIGVVKKSLLVF